MLSQVVVERCEECGFDGAGWSDAEAFDVIAELPERWRAATAGISAADVRGRPIAGVWSIAEYVDHVREVLFGMRFVLDSAVAEPGIDLGAGPEPAFEPSPRHIDVESALAGIAREAESLRQRLREINPRDWDSTAIVGDHEVDAHWISRHAVHDATHHLLDVERLHAALSKGRS
jgi:hypothetical protein